MRGPVRCVSMFIFFFFQAEDGIRDLTVTGVQTCALPISTGTLLWKFKTPSGIIGNPMTYLGPDGKQYVAVLSGVGGWAGAGVALGIGPEDPTAALGAIGAFGDYINISNAGGTLLVFSL